MSDLTHTQGFGVDEHPSTELFSCGSMSLSECLRSSEYQADLQVCQPLFARRMWGVLISIVSPEPVCTGFCVLA